MKKTSYFQDWASVRGITEELHEMGNETLDRHLRRFYAEVKAMDGKEYSRLTLLGIRYSIERYPNAPPHNKGISISGNPQFKSSNTVLNAKIKSLKQAGSQNFKHKPPIEAEDVEKLKSSCVFSPSSPLSLLRNVWFHVLLLWCRRSREGQRNLTKSSFVFATDASSEEYVSMTHCESSKTTLEEYKNRRASSTWPVCIKQKKKTMLTLL